MIEERLRSFIAAADDADWQDVLQRGGKTARPAALRFARRRLTLALAACIAVATPAVVFSGAFGSHRGQVPPARGGSRPMGYMPITLQFTRGGQGITSINVTVNSPIRDATMRLQVLRGNPYGPNSNRQVVFQEQMPMANISSPAEGPPGIVALSAWSGTLSPSDWDGGCQDGLYSVAWVDVPSGSSFPPSGRPYEGESEWFRCSSS
jgi:hypothetical protein